MGTVRRVAATLAIVGGGGYLYYRYGLTDEGRERVHAAVTTLRDGMQIIAANVGPVVESMRQEATRPHSASSNREETRRQWTELGY